MGWQFSQSGLPSEWASFESVRLWTTINMLESMIAEISWWNGKQSYFAGRAGFDLVRLQLIDSPHSQTPPSIIDGSHDIESPSPQPCQDVWGHWGNMRLHAWPMGSGPKIHSVHQFVDASLQFEIPIENLSWKFWPNLQHHQIAFISSVNKHGHSWTRSCETREGCGYLVTRVSRFGYWKPTPARDHMAEKKVWDMLLWSSPRFAWIESRNCYLYLSPRYVAEVRPWGWYTRKMIALRCQIYNSSWPHHGKWFGIILTRFLSPVAFIAPVNSSQISWLLVVARVASKK